MASKLERLARLGSLTTKVGGSYLGQAVAGLGAQPACGAANNSMVTVRGGAGVHAFFLRVASGFVPHWTASY